MIVIGDIFVCNIGKDTVGDKSTNELLHSVNF